TAGARQVAGRSVRGGTGWLLVRRRWSGAFFLRGKGEKQVSRAAGYPPAAGFQHNPPRRLNTREKAPTAAGEQGNSQHVVVVCRANLAETPRRVVAQIIRPETLNLASPASQSPTPAALCP